MWHFRCYRHQLVDKRLNVNSETQKACTVVISQRLSSLLTASTRFTTDLAKFFVCCLLLCRLYYGRKKRQQPVFIYLYVYGSLKGDAVALPYHTVVHDNHDLQILHLLKHTARRLHHKKTSVRLFSSTTTGTRWRVLKGGWVSRIARRDARSETYCPLFPALQPREFIELWEELLLLICAHKHVY